MSDPSSSAPASDPVVADAAPASESSTTPAVVSDTNSSSSTAPTSKVTDPAQVALPDEDDNEQAWHKATIIAEEDIRERVTIPVAFANKYLWSPLVAAPEPSSSSTDPVLGAHPTSHVVIPPALLADAHAALSTALSNSTQLASVHPKPSPPPAPAASTESTTDSTTPATPADPVVPAEPEVLTEPIVTLFCPFDNSAAVIDTIVSGVGQSQRADVLVLDALMLSQGEAGPLGPGE